MQTLNELAIALANASAKAAAAKAAAAGAHKLINALRDCNAEVAKLQAQYNTAALAATAKPAVK